MPRILRLGLEGLPILKSLRVYFPEAVAFTGHPDVTNTLQIPSL
jgi:hypothetical protein